MDATTTDEPDTTGPAPESVTLLLGAFDEHGTTRARFNDRSVEVEHGIPGETVEATITGRARLRGHIVEVIEPSPDRIMPPCVYFRDWRCGGCQWQQISYPGQIERKLALVDAAMRQSGLDVMVTDSYALDDPWRYRTTASISLGRSAGFRRHGSLAIVPLRDCPISHPAIGTLMDALNDLLETHALPDFRGRARLDVRVVGGAEACLEILVRPDRDRRPEEASLLLLTGALRDMDAVSGVSLQIRGGSHRVLSGAGFGTVEVAGKNVVTSATSFFQTNIRLMPDLIARLRELAEPLAGKRVADVYAGVGVFGLFLAAEARKVVVIEDGADAIEAGRRTASEWGLTNATFVNGSAEDNLERLMDLDVVILDPPRAGLSEAVLQFLMTGGPPLVLYVSCLARSLAHDLAVLVPAGYLVEALELFDFYPQTYHVELLAVLRREQPSHEDIAGQQV